VQKHRWLNLGVVEKMTSLQKIVTKVKPKAPPDPPWIPGLAYELEKQHDEALRATRQSVWDHLGDRCNGSFCRPLFAGEYGMAKLGADTPAIIIGTIRTEKDTNGAPGDETATLNVYVMACSPTVHLLVGLYGDRFADILLQLLEEGKLTPTFRDEFEAAQGYGYIHTVGYEWTPKAVFDLLALPKFTSEGAKL
jgi:hypothetical protein